jgi:uncharacterized integral membrane protein
MKCPNCQAAIELDKHFPSKTNCNGCGISLKTNWPWILVAFLFLWALAVIAMYNQWPTFTFFVGDWLSAILIASLVTPFARVDAEHKN